MAVVAQWQNSALIGIPVMSIECMNALRGQKILVVDDAEADRMLLFTFLRQLECRVYQAHDGIDGLHKARLIRPDAILMDLDMPRCNGYDACKLLYSDSRTQRIPVIFLSCHSEAEDRIKGLMYGAVDYIAKPFNFDEVRLRLSIHLRNLASGAPGEDTKDNDREVEGQAAEGVASERARSHLDDILFRSAQVHLLSSLDHAPGLQELARSVGTNAKQLNRSFKACIGLTVYEYLREERMKEARRLLMATDMPVSDIAAAVGFSSIGSFSTAFKHRFGAAPSHCRRRGKLI